MNNALTTLDKVLKLSGVGYTAEEQERISALLPVLSNALRFEAQKVGKNLDAMISADESGAYGSVVEMTMVDIVVRYMRQTLQGDPMTQESQAALGYSWSGTYTLPGGGLSNSIMKNDLKRLGLRRQRIGWMHLYE